MKALLVTSIFLLTSTILPAQGPATWSQSTAYTHPALVINGTTTYISIEDVPANTAITNTTYWATLDSLVPTDTPSGADSLTAPDASEVENLTVPDSDPSVSRFLGISTRGPVTASSFLHAGIAINGSDTKTIIFMAKGPLLANYGVPGVLSDPLIEIYDVSGNKIYENDSWGSASGNQNLSVYNGKPGITMPVDAAEAGIAVSLAPGAYTAVVKGANGSEGIALVEAYEVSGETPNTSLLGISTRGPVTASSYMHAGIGIEGTASKKVAFMCKGPLLTNYGVPGALADPVLEIYDVSGAVIYSNDSWDTASGDQSILAYDGKPGITQPASTAEAALVVTLSPGAYTAVLKGANGTEGIGLIEAYEIAE